MIYSLLKDKVFYKVVYLKKHLIYHGYLVSVSCLNEMRGGVVLLLLYKENESLQFFYVKNTILSK